MAATETEADVVVQIGGEDAIAGRLWGHRRRGGESATFAYTADYLARPDAYALDPALPLDAGQHQTPGRRSIFGAFSDCAPDRWGRRLIARTEQRRARREGDAERSFGEIDYLLGVRDDLRQGALRFRDLESGAFLADERHGIPPFVQLPALLDAAEGVERDEATDAQLETLLRGGSSLGGARPKAHVLDGDGRVAIAKFPSPVNDDWDVMRWEAVALTLARQSGVRVPDWALHEIGGKAVLVIDRFDRDDGWRIGYVSALTMLELDDGERGSYLDIASTVEERSPRARHDLRELWRRIVYSVLISNTDDHLRNHGFLRDSSAGWSLSPAFDLNPDPRPGEKLLTTAIDQRDTTASVELALAVAPYFRLDDDEARTVLGEVVAATDRWREVASSVGLATTDVEDMAPAFEHEQAAAARRIAGGGERHAAHP